MHTKEMTKEQMMEKIRQITKDEKFRMDAYFFCGFPAGKPNSALLKACETYLTAEGDKDAAEQLIAALEAAVAEKEKSAHIDNLVDNLTELKEVLDHRELLLK